jgi:hypothetical protein
VAGTHIPFMEALGNWNILIGMGGMAAAFALATWPIACRPVTATARRVTRKTSP